MELPLLNQEPICRVCRSSSSPEQPLYHPCKCSGSMKFIHQSCLEEWLSVSSKTKCEICNYTFKFTSIYSLDSENMTLSVLMSVVKQRLVKWIPFYFRTLLVVCAWFVFAPLGTFWIYTIQFKSVSQILLDLKSFFVNLKSVFVVLGTPTPKSMRESLSLLPSLFQLLQHPKMMTFYSTLLHSQLITLYIVLATICIISLREFILTNTSQEELKRYKRNKQMLKSLKILQNQTLTSQERSKADASTLQLLLDNQNDKLELQDLKSIIYYIHVCLEARKLELKTEKIQDFNFFYKNPIDLKLKQLFALFNHVVVNEKNPSVLQWCRFMIKKKKLEYEELKKQINLFAKLHSRKEEESLQGQCHMIVTFKKGRGELKGTVSHDCL